MVRDIIKIVLNVFILLVITYFIIVGIYFSFKVNGVLEEKLFEDRMTLNVENFGKNRLNALLKVEDPKFYEHNGVDFKTPGNGLRTITQEVSKELFFKKYYNNLSKPREIISSLILNSKLSKKKQLDLFFNNIYLGEIQGRKIYGFEEASKIYFKKSYKDLNEDEFLAIVATINEPNKFNPIENSLENKKRVSRIKLMLMDEYIPETLFDVEYNRGVVESYASSK